MEIEVGGGGCPPTLRDRSYYNRTRICIGHQAITKCVTTDYTTMYGWVIASDLYFLILIEFKQCSLENSYHLRLNFVGTPLLLQAVWS